MDRRRSGQSWANFSRARPKLRAGGRITVCTRGSWWAAWGANKERGLVLRPSRQKVERAERVGVAHGRRGCACKEEDEWQFAATQESERASRVRAPESRRHGGRLQARQLARSTRSEPAERGPRRDFRSGPEIFCSLSDVCLRTLRAPVSCLEAAAAAIFAGK